MRRLFTAAIATVLMLVMMTACGSGDTIMTIQGKDIPKGEVTFILRELEAMYEGQYGPNIWTAGYEGQTFNDIAKEGALESITRLYITSLEAETKGITLTDEEKEEADAQVEEYFANVAEEVLKEDGISKEDIRQIFLLNAIGEKLMDAELVDFVIDEEALKVALEEDPSYQQIQKYGYEGVLEQVTAQHILISTVNEDQSEKTDEEKAKALETAEMVLGKVNAGEDFDTLVAEYSEDPGSEANGGTYTFYKGEMQKEFEDAAFNMEIDEVSNLVTTVFGYHIIKKIDHIYPAEEDIQNVMEYEGFIVEQHEMMQKQGEYEGLYTQWKENYDIEVNEKNWSKVQTSFEKEVEANGGQDVAPGE